MIDNFDDIQKPFRTHLNTLLSSGDEVAWENVKYTPTQGKMFIKEDLLHGSENPSATNEVAQMGIMQYTVLATIGTGTKAVKEKADAIKQGFKPSTILSNKVYINASRVVSGQSSNGWYSLLVQIEYSIYAPNN